MLFQNLFTHLRDSDMAGILLSLPGLGYTNF